MSDSIEKSTIMWFGGLLFGAVTTTATAVHFLHEHFITPVKVFESNQKVDKLTEKLNSQPDITNELAKTKEKLNLAQQKLSQIEYSNLFLANDIYPATIAIVKLGENVSRVYEVYDKSQISSGDDTPSQPTLRVALKNSVFYSVSYSYDPKSKLIKSVGFFLDQDKDLGTDFLKSSVSKALGAPNAVGDKGQYKWQNPDGISAYILRDTYLLLNKGLVPRVWGGNLTE